MKIGEKIVYYPPGSEVLQGMLRRSWYPNGIEGTIVDISPDGKTIAFVPISRKFYSGQPDGRWIINTPIFLTIDFLVRLLKKETE